MIKYVNRVWGTGYCQKIIVTIQYTYNERKQLTEKKAFNGRSHYEYDKRGNRVLETSEHTQENRRICEWDATNQLSRTTRSTDWNFKKDFLWKNC